MCPRPVGAPTEACPSNSEPRLFAGAFLWIFEISFASNYHNKSLLYHIISCEKFRSTRLVVTKPGVRDPLLLRLLCCAQTLLTTSGAAGNGGALMWSESGNIWKLHVASDADDRAFHLKVLLKAHYLHTLMLPCWRNANHTLSHTSPGGRDRRTWSWCSLGLRSS